MRPLRIATLLAAKGDAVATIDGDATVHAVVAQLRTRGIGALVVSADGEHIDGIVSERDIVRGLFDRHGSLLDQPVRSIMTARVFTCSPDDDLDWLATVMTERRIRHVPVLRDGVLAGIVSIGDVVKQRMEELEQDRRELVEYITAR
ncbi:MAG TPA: CBS domain-containing protein [Acidimicrobiales bacterium]|nr:CBS domain-containing protein [Acidimicrobiales bacterium]